MSRLDRAGGALIGAGMLAAIEQALKEQPAPGILLLGLLAAAAGALAIAEGHDRRLDQAPPEYVELRPGRHTGALELVIFDTAGNEHARLQLSEEQPGQILELGQARRRRDR